MISIICVMPLTRWDSQDYNDEFEGAPKFTDNRPGWEDRSFPAEWGHYYPRLFSESQKLPQLATLTLQHRSRGIRFRE